MPLEPPQQPSSLADAKHMEAKLGKSTVMSLKIHTPILNGTGLFTYWLLGGDLKYVSFLHPTWGNDTV